MPAKVGGNQTMKAFFKTEHEALSALATCKGARWTVQLHSSGFWQIVRARDQDLFPLETFNLQAK
jgi:hypothetical protein